MTLDKSVMNTIFTDRKKFVKKVNVAGAVIAKLGEKGETLILLIRRSPTDHWPLHFEFPRGKCDQGLDEDTIKCLKREVKEETGLDVRILRFIDKFTYIADSGRRESTQYNYLCQMKDPKQPVKLSHEHDDFKWISSMGEVELMTLPEMKKTISKVLDLDERIVDYPTNNFSGETKIKEMINKIFE